MASNKNKNKEKTVESAPVEQVFVPENEPASEKEVTSLSQTVIALREGIESVKLGHREIDLAIDELKTLLARVESLAKFIKGAQDSVKKK